MSGHSKWATTKHKKALVDARRGKLFAKLIKNVEVAARTGGPDPAGNPNLYDAVQKAKKSSVPNDNIDRAIRRGVPAHGRDRAGRGPSQAGVPADRRARGLRRRAGRVRELLGLRRHHGETGLTAVGPGCTGRRRRGAPARHAGRPRGRADGGP